METSLPSTVRLSVAAAISGLSRSYLRKLVDAGEIDAVRITRERRIVSASLLALLRQRGPGAPTRKKIDAATAATMPLSRAAKRIGVSRQVIREMIEKSQLEAVTINRCRRVLTSSVLKLLKSHKEPTDAAPP